MKVALVALLFAAPAFAQTPPAASAAVERADRSGLPPATGQLLLKPVLALAGIIVGKQVSIAVVPARVARTAPGGEPLANRPLSVFHRYFRIQLSPKEGTCRGNSCLRYSRSLSQ